MNVYSFFDFCSRHYIVDITVVSLLTLLLGFILEHLEYQFFWGFFSVDPGLNQEDIILLGTLSSGMLLVSFFSESQNVLMLASAVYCAVNLVEKSATSSFRLCISTSFPHGSLVLMCLPPQRHCRCLLLQVQPYIPRPVTAG